MTTYRQTEYEAIILEQVEKRRDKVTRLSQQVGFLLSYFTRIYGPLCSLALRAFVEARTCQISSVF